MRLPSAPSLPSRQWIDAALLALLSVGALYLGARSALVPRDPEQGVAVVFAPWTAPDAAMIRTVEAGAKFVRFGGFGFVTVAMPDDRQYPARALAHGAWLVLDPKVVAACLTPFGIGAQSL